MGSNVYDDDSIIVIRDDIEKIRQRPESYIGYRHWGAYKHLIKEIIQNSIDEAAATLLTNAKNKCNEIIVDYDERTKCIVIVDNGRGIPQKKLFDICTVIQSSGKFNKGSESAYKLAAGENGVGTTCANALSKKFNITSQRDGIKKTLMFEYGKLVNEKIEKCDNKKTGTTVMMIPDEVILKSIKSDYNDLLSLCETMAYISKVPITINVHVTTKNGKDINDLYYFKNGIKDLIGSLSRDPICKPIYIQYEGEEMLMEAIFLYDPENDLITKTGDNNLIISFANFCTTIDGGTHVEGFKAGLSTFMTKYVRDNCLNKKEQTEMSILGEDARNGLLAVINVHLVEASFVGQTKQKLSTPEMNNFVKNALVNGLNKWSKENTNIAKKLGEYIKNMAKQRINSSKERKQYLNKNYSNRIDSINIKSWSGKATSKHLKHELYIVEGDSAGGSVKIAMDKRFQESYKLRGVPKNTDGMSYLEVLQNEEFKNLATIVTDAKGNKVKPEECPYDKIIIATDADVDGNRITSLSCLFFILHLKQLVLAGKIYKLAPPLYKVTKNKKNIYLDDNKAYAKYVQGDIVKHITIYVEKNNQLEKLKDKEIAELILNTQDYYKDLKRMSDNKVTDSKLFEYILMQLHHLKENKFNKFVKAINKFGKDLNIEDDGNEVIVSGIYNMDSQFIRINKKFISKVKSLTNYLDNDDNYKYFVVNDNRLQLVELLEVFESYKPANRQRFKGLGEMKPEQLDETCLRPGQRRLIQLTVDDLDQALETFNVLHGKTVKWQKERKLLMSKFKINIEDIDS